MNHREEANMLVAACIRNNTSLETIHSEGGIDDEEMRTLMIEVCSNLASVLECRDRVPRSMYEAFLAVGSLGSAAGWDMESKTGGLVLPAEAILQSNLSELGDIAPESNQPSASGRDEGEP